MRELEMYLETADTDPGAYRRLDLNHENGYVPQEINFGFPDIRDNVSKRPSANGTDDYTRFFGASAVQIKLALEPTMMAVPVSERKLEDALRRWLNPVRRTWLVYRQRGEDDWRRVLVRGSNGARTLQLATTTWGQVSMVFRAPKGYSESNELFEKNLPFTGTELGRTYDLTFDRTYPVSGVVGIVEVENLGNVDVFPIVRVYGPCTDFRLDNLTTGLTLKFKTAFQLLASEFLVIDFEEGTVLMGGDLNNSRYNERDTAVSEWWTLAEGLNLIRPVAATYTAPQAHMEIFWRHNYL